MADKTPKKDAKKADDEKDKAPAAEPETDAAAEETAEDKKPPAKKPEKTYTKAEQDAAIAKAVADAKKKFDEERDLSELERLQKENDDLKAERRLNAAKESVLDALTKAGGRSPELMYRSIASELEFDDKGTLKNLDALVAGLKADYADLFGTPKPQDGIDAGKGQEGDGSSRLTKEKLNSMSTAEISALDWEKDVVPVLSGK